MFTETTAGNLAVVSEWIRQEGNAMPEYHPLIGLQNSVCAFVDPLHAERLSSELRRTGEGVDMPVQDGAPDKQQFFNLLEEYGVDFLMQQVMPGEAEHMAFLDEMMHHKRLGFLMANEFSNINLRFVPGTNRGDFSEAVARRAKQHPGFLGFLYDETEHLQVHPNIYRRDPSAPTRWQWADPTGKSLQQLEDAVTGAVAADCRRLESPLFSEHVFSILFHAFARGGMNLMPKLLKEEYQSVQLASALGAAVQYRVDFGLCVDMWGPDVGPWFTRKWGFPGHSPEEFENGLKLAWHYSPSLMFVENVDPLARFSQERGFEDTEFGEIFRRFVKEYVPAHPLPYRFSEALADIAFVRADDGLFSAGGAFDGRTMYGSEELAIDEHHKSVFRAWHLLSQGTVPDDQIYYFGPRYETGKRHFPVTPETIRQLPLPNGVPKAPAEARHGLFYPMNGVLAFDQHLAYHQLEPAKLIVLAGSRATPGCVNAILRRVSQGATLVAVPWLMPPDCRHTRELGKGKMIISERFDEPELLDRIKHDLGSRETWSQRFGAYRLVVRNPSGDGVRLDFAIEEGKP